MVMVAAVSSLLPRMTNASERNYFPCQSAEIGAGKEDADTNLPGESVLAGWLAGWLADS